MTQQVKMTASLFSSRTQAATSAAIHELVEDDSSVLPNFCRGYMILKVVILAEILTMAIIVLTQTRYTGNLIAELVTVSLFIQWIALASTATLCRLRPWLNSLPPVHVVLLAYLILLAVAVIVSELAVWVLYVGGYIKTARPDWYTSFHIQNFLVAVFINALVLHYLLAVHQLRMRTMNAAELHSQVRRYRVRPRFLFNTLNNIAGLMRRRPAVAEAATEELADLVRLMLDEKNELTVLNREIANAQKFVSLETLRLEDRLVVNWNIDKAVDHSKTPVQVLQLLLEHVIDVGVEPFTDGGVISVNISTSDNYVHLDVSCRPSKPLAEDAPVDVLVSGYAPMDKLGDKLGDKPEYEQVPTYMAKHGPDSENGSRHETKTRSQASPQSKSTQSRSTQSRSTQSRSTWHDTAMLDNIKLRLHDIYGVKGALTLESDTNRLLISVTHPAEGGSH